MEDNSITVMMSAVRRVILVAAPISALGSVAIAMAVIAVSRPNSSRATNRRSRQPRMMALMIATAPTTPSPGRNDSTPAPKAR